jgi:hypothetical protein
MFEPSNSDDATHLAGREAHAYTPRNGTARASC